MPGWLQTVQFRPPDGGSGAGLQAGRGPQAQRWLAHRCEGAGARSAPGGRRQKGPQTNLVGENPGAGVEGLGPGVSTGGPWEGDPGATAGLEGPEGWQVPGAWPTHMQMLPTCPPGRGLGRWGVRGGGRLLLQGLVSSSWGSFACHCPEGVRPPRQQAPKGD